MEQELLIQRTLEDEGEQMGWILGLLSGLQSADYVCEAAIAGEDGAVCAVGADPARPAWLLLCCLGGGGGSLTQELSHNHNWLASNESFSICHKRNRLYAVRTQSIHLGRNYVHL